MNAQQTINSLEEERQALYALGNGPDVDTYARRARLEAIEAKLHKAWEVVRAERAARYVGTNDAAWAQAR